MPVVSDGGISAFAQGSRTGYQNNPFAAALLGGYKGFRESQAVQMDQEQVNLAKQEFDFLKQQKQQEQQLQEDQFRQVGDLAQIQFERGDLDDQDVRDFDSIRATGGSAEDQNDFLMKTRETKETKAGELKRAHTYIASKEPDFFEDDGSSWSKAQEYLDQFEIKGGGMTIDMLMDNLKGVYEPHKSKGAVAASKAKTQMDEADRGKRTVYVDDPNDPSREIPLFTIPKESYGDGENLIELLNSGERGNKRAVAIFDELKQLYEQYGEQLGEMTLEEFIVEHAGWTLE